MKARGFFSNQTGTSSACQGMGQHTLSLGKCIASLKLKFLLFGSELWSWIFSVCLYSTILKQSPLGSGSLQGEKDWQKYETARRLKKCVDKIRNQYREDWKSKEMKVRQRAVALYFIDKVRASSCHTAYHVHLHEDGGGMYFSRPCALSTAGEAVTAQ